MNEIKFETDKKDVIIHTPSEWNELTRTQLIFVAPRVMLANKSRRLRSEILFHFIGFKIPNLSEMNLSQLTGLFPAVDWLWKSPELTKNLLPKFKIDNVEFFGPEDELKDITVSQFAFADKFMSMFMKKKEEEYLDLLIGTLYHNGKKFFKEYIESNAEIIHKLPLDERLAILAFYIGSRNKIARDNPDIFKKQNKIKRNRSGWLGFFYELAGPKTGTYKQVADMNFFEMLGIMRKINDDAYEAEKRNKRR